jgi:hypothetical protein
LSYATYQSKRKLKGPWTMEILLYLAVLALGILVDACVQLFQTLKA